MGKAKQNKKKGVMLDTDGNRAVGSISDGKPIRVVKVPGYGLPDRLKVNLVYEDTINLAGGVPAPNAQVFLMNSCYDPDSTSTGHQPQQYDQIVAIYSKYLVTHFSYQFEMINAATAPCKWVVVFSETDISGRTVDQLSEMPYAAFGTLNVTTGGGATRRLQGKFPLKKLYGQRLLDPDTTMYANYNSSPSDGLFCIIKVASLDGSSNANVYVRSKLIYHTYFKDRNEPSASLLKPVVESKANRTTDVVNGSSSDFEMFRKYLKWQAENSIS